MHGMLIGDIDALGCLEDDESGRKHSNKCERAATEIVKEHAGVTAKRESLYNDFAS